MGYLLNNIISVDAILTRKGRSALAKGSGFNITQFAIADDEVDYSLWNTSHPLGTSFYGSAIENMPLIEASPDETQSMRYKLVTLPRGTSQIPIIALGFSNIILTAGQQNAFVVSPSTNGGFNGPGFGYTLILYNADAAVVVGSGLVQNQTATAPSFLGSATTEKATFVQGMQFTITPKNVPATIITQISVIGNQTGAIVSVPLTVNPVPRV
jgi:hypothetical protein